MKKIIFICILFLNTVFLNTVFSQGVIINEILASNTISNSDEDGTRQDWVELYNNGTMPVDFTGYGLTDDTALLYKWVFPSVVVAPDSYLLIWCSDKNRTNPANPLHTNFKISAAGEVISLTNPGGTTVDFVPATTISSDISYGRLPNGTGSFVFFETITPNALNSATGYSEVLPPPTFSQNSGFFTTGFNLSISTTVTDATILYTLDGSEPNANNLGGTTYSYKNQYPEHPGQLTGPLLNKSFQTLSYTTPIPIADRSLLPNKIASISSTYNFTPTYIPENPIFKGTIVRAKVIKSGALASKTASKSYFISPQGSNRFTLPVVSLSINENKLFDYNAGIYVAGVDFDTWRTLNPTLEPEFVDYIGNYNWRGIEYERVANFNYFVNGTEVINQDVGIRIQGGTSRAWQNKSMSLYSRSEYGNDSMDYLFFSDLSDASFERLTLKNSGNDFFNTMFRDALNQKLCKELRAETKSYQPTVTFINGEYWGILNISEKYDNNYFQRVYNIPGNQLDFLENDGISEEYIEEGDNIDYLNMMAYVENNSLLSNANFDYIKTRLDPENFTDYFIANIFFDNTDWPGTNIQFWRKKTTAYEPSAPYGHDGRWRWAFHDMDGTFSFGSENFNNNTLAMATALGGPEWPNPEWSTLLLRKLLENPTFKTDFINRFADLMNTSFLSSRIVATLISMKTAIETEMPENISRWESIDGMDEWNYYLNYEQDFANARPVFQRNHIRSKFGISSNINATLDVSDSTHGYIQINTIEVKDGTPGIAGNPYPWIGIYFSNIPVKLKAIANPGFVFSHWTGASTSSDAEITINSATNFALTAVFIPSVVAVSEPIYFWMMDGTMPNNLPLETLNTTFEFNGTDGFIQYQSCLVGYPFTSASINWRKASMERRNNPTTINYIPEANNNLPFATSDMKGLQIKEPLHNNGLENAMLFNFNTTGYENIKFSFARINELTNASDIIVDYSVNTGIPVWITTGLASISLPLTASFQLAEVDFSAIPSANNNPDFKIRLRFAGTNMTVDAGNRISFNNIAVFGTQIQLHVAPDISMKFKIFPNPFFDFINIIGINAEASYKIFTIEGRLVKAGNWVSVSASPIDLSELNKGMYLLQVKSGETTETKKIIKK